MKGPSLDIFRKIPRSTSYSHRHPKFGKHLELSEVREHITTIERSLNINTWEDWYLVKREHLIQYSPTLLVQFNDSLLALLTEVYPHRPWVSWKFAYIGHKFWSLIKNQRDFMDYVAVEKKYNGFEDFYGLSNFDVESLRGKGLLLIYNGSVFDLLKTCYPEHHWLSWKMNRSPRRIWGDLRVQKMYFDTLATEFGIKNWRDWENINTKQFSQAVGGSGLLNNFYGNSLMLALETIYPEHPWRTLNRSRRPMISKPQNRIHTLIDELSETRKTGVAGEQEMEIFYNFIHPELRYGDTNKAMTFDVFIPSKLLALEYQGEQHYEDSTKYGRAEDQQKRDREKRDSAAKIGIRVVEIPHWYRTLSVKEIEKLLDSTLEPP